MRAINNILVLEIYTHSNFASALSKINANRKFWINFSGSECLFMGFFEFDIHLVEVSYNLEIS